MLQSKIHVRVQHANETITSRTGSLGIHISVRRRGRPGPRGPGACKKRRHGENGDENQETGEKNQAVRRSEADEEVRHDEEIEPGDALGQEPSYETAVFAARCVVNRAKHHTLFPVTGIVPVELQSSHQPSITQGPQMTKLIAALIAAVFAAATVTPVAFAAADEKKEKAEAKKDGKAEKKKDDKAKADEKK